LFLYDNAHLLSKESVETMVPKVELDTSVIDCWAMLLNDLTVMNNSKSSKIFFGVHYSVSYVPVFVVIQLSSITHHLILLLCLCTDLF